MERPTLLFVDRTHGARAVMAHLYAELVRVWSANNGQAWLFRRAAGAGYMIESRFRTGPGRLSPNETLIPKATPLNETAMNALFKDATDFWSDNSPYEKTAIVRRMKARRKQGLPAEMVTYTHIVCFDDETVRAVTLLCEVARSVLPDGESRPRPTIVKITGCPYKSEKELPALAGSIRAGLKELFRVQLGWIRPPKSFTGGAHRTNFMQLKHEWQKETLLGKDQMGLQRLKAKFNCRFHVAYDSKWTGWLLTITGPRPALPEVSQKISDMLSENN